MRTVRGLNFRGCAAITAFFLAFLGVTAASGADASREPVISICLHNGSSRLHLGQTVTIAWRGTSGPQKAWVSLWIEKIRTGHLIGPIASSLPVRGRLRWRIPDRAPPRIPCKIDQTRTCVDAIAPGQRYAIVARLYTVADGSPVAIPADAAPKRLLASAKTQEFVILSTKS